MYDVEILKILDETHDVKTFRLTRPEGFDFISGQYCTIKFSEGHAYDDERRPFTFSSSPNADYLDLTIKEMHEFSKELFKLKVTDRLILFGPKGKSLNFDQTVNDVVFIAGGSGIAPFMSALRFVKENQLKNKIILLNSNREHKDIIFKDELESLNKLDNIQIINILTRSDNKKRINSELINEHIQNWNNYSWYICGPPKMVEDISNILKQEGVTDIRKEDWQLPGKGD